MFLNTTSWRAILLSFACTLTMSCDMSDNKPGNGNQDNRDEDAAITDFPIAYIKRPMPVDEDGNPVVDNILEPDAFNPGAQLFIKRRASTSAAEINITEGVFGYFNAETLEYLPPGDTSDVEKIEPLYDIKDLETNATGTKLVFAMRAPEIEDADEEDQPKWNIWMYDLEREELERVISSNIEAEKGDDVSPHFLASGDIVFASNRQVGTRGLLLDDLKPQYSGLAEDRQEEAFTLHTMSAEGGDIEQITYNVSHDVQPTVLSNGKVAYLRWDRFGHNQLSLYTVNPDGSQAELLYGFHSQNTGTADSQAAFYAPRELEDGRIMVNLRPRQTARLGGKPVAINTQSFTDLNQTSFADFGATGPAQQTLTNKNIDERYDANAGMASISLDGIINSVYPLYDGTERLLISWSPCRLDLDRGQIEEDPEAPSTEEQETNYGPCIEPELSQPDVTPAPPLFSLWVYDPIDQTQLPITRAEEGLMATEAIALGPRAPASPISSNLDSNLRSEGVGVLHIRNIYDVDGVVSVSGGINGIADPAVTPPDQREARFLRLIKNVPWPSEDVLDFEIDQIHINGGGRRIREIIGYVPIEPDGSAKFKVPADIAFTFDIIDAEGKRIDNNDQHRLWMTLRAGEQRDCSGCHTRNNPRPHGRSDAEAPSVYPGAIGGQAFANTLLLNDTLPEEGQTMAEYYAMAVAPRTPAMDLIFTDEWTDPAAATPGSDISLRYVDFSATINANPRDANCAPLATQPPVWTIPFRPDECNIEETWTRQCRILINYLDQIGPLWEADRRSCDSAGLITANHTCTSCHSDYDTINSIQQVPAGQLNLSSAADANQPYTVAYAQLFDSHPEIATDGTIVGPRTNITDSPVNLQGDPNYPYAICTPIDNDDPLTPEIEPQTFNCRFEVPAVLDEDGARSNNNFFRLFEPGGSHQGYLSNAELKLIAEWLDLGGQYYNNPFDIPAD